MARKKHKLELTDLELISLVSILDTFSAVSDGFWDNYESKKDLNRVDKMLEKNGFKREHH